MINFGVREVANTKSISAPGWAYVPDTGVNASVAALQPSSRKRARGITSATLHETTAKQDAKIVRELAALDRENHRDVSIPVPIRHRDNAGRVSHGKVTPGIRKILASQKTFANHLSDYEALSALSTSLPTSSSQPQSMPSIPATPAIRSTPGASNPNLTSTGTRSHKKKDPNGPPPSTSTEKRSHKKKDLNAPAISTPLRQSSTPAPIKTEPPLLVDTEMADILSLSPGNSKEPVSHPGDSDPLLMSRVPEMPTEEELRKLLAVKPLSYNEARGPWTADDKRTPVRTFCEVCGYWGRVRCTKCGVRVCALECLKTHQEECFTRYGA